VCGGRNGRYVIQDCESYSLYTQEWTDFDPFPVAIEGNAMLWLPTKNNDAYLISFGGHRYDDDNDEVINTV
jgi:hypothetical protein